MSEKPVEAPADSSGARRRLFLLSLAALGVVYGDIGTSPLYAVRECFAGVHAMPATAVNICGAISLIFWSLAITVTLKYVVFVLRADNHGEGGTFSLVRLMPNPGDGWTARLHGVVVLAGIAGVSLLYGDAIITPAISILSAIEGIQIATPQAERWVRPLTCAVLVMLFSFQHRGTAHIGRLFGPIMAVWFVAIGCLGFAGILTNFAILSSANPMHAMQFFAENRWHGFFILGSVALCVTGVEALYADLGHFNKSAIRLSWTGFVWPSLLLNYLGQGAYLLNHPDETLHPFYALAPRVLLYPYVGLATLATIIASQAMISAMFSLTQQAIQLGFMPRQSVVHTSHEVKGQIYMPGVNWALFVACLALVLGFKSSSRLAGAYGIAVTASMSLTSTIFLFVLIRRFRWPWWKASLLVGLFLVFDLSFFGANLLKIKDGGWVPLAVAGTMTTIMLTWRDGRARLSQMFTQRMPDEAFIEDVRQQRPQRIPGVGVFLSASHRGIPVTLLHHYKFNRVFHERVILFSSLTSERPFVPRKERVEIEDLGEGFYRLRAYFGFMERPRFDEVLGLAKEKGLDVNPVAYYVGHETLVTDGDIKMARWRKNLFAFMSRNALNPTNYFGLPPEKVIELGVRIRM